MNGSRNTLFEPLQITDPSTSVNPLIQGTPSQGAALADLYTAAMAERERQMQISRERGLWTGGEVWQGGHPTSAGVADIGGQYANALLMGTTAPGARYSLEPVHSRTLRPLANEPGLEQAGSRTYAIKDPAGENVGTVDAAWNPETGNLHIEDFQSTEGKNTLGVGTIRQLRDALLKRYPDARTLTGQRITGAVSADRPSGSGPGRAASQAILPSQ